MAHDLALNLDPTTWSFAPSDSNRRIRIWWGLYIHDKWTALSLGRPSYLNDENCNVPALTANHFAHLGINGESLAQTPALRFVATASLTTILSDVLDTFYTLKAVDGIKNLPSEMLLSLLSGFQTRLTAWNENHLARLSDTNTFLDSSGSTILAYHTVEIVVLRAVLRSLPMEDKGYQTVRNQAKAVLMDVVHFLEKLNVSRLRAFWWSRKFSHLLSTQYTIHKFDTQLTCTSNDTNKFRSRGDIHVLPAAHLHLHSRHRVLVRNHLPLSLASAHAEPCIRYDKAGVY